MTKVQTLPSTSILLSSQRVGMKVLVPKTLENKWFLYILYNIFTLYPYILDTSYLPTFCFLSTTTHPPQGTPGIKGWKGTKEQDQ